MTDLEARLEQALRLLRRSQEILAEVDDDALPASGEVLEAELRGFLAHPPDSSAMLRELQALRPVLEAARRLLPFLPHLDNGAIRYSEHAQAAGALRTACAEADKARVP